ncbi:sigma-70 family RNA polymerase sigma factor [Streptomyces uncialis]|uniref:sigma-70 family RNA polymerase sigma factor n=1 Tax=Streptomyces uncialis TaxID=1048205 RepID=UPI00381C4E81
MQAQHTDDRECAGWVVAAQRGDRAARDRLAAAYLPLVYNVVGRALDGHADVDDVVQETMLRALGGLSGLREPERFRSWLVAIAMNQVRRRWTAADRRRTASLQEIGEGGHPAAAVADFTELTILRLRLSGQRREVAEATRWLDPDDRDVLSLWWLEAAGELTRGDLSAALGLPRRHVSVRVQRVKAQLDIGRAVVRALAAAHPCPGLTGLTATWDGRPGPLWRKRIARHTRGCPDCADRSADLLPVEGLLSGVGLVVPLSPALPVLPDPGFPAAPTDPADPADPATSAAFPTDPATTTALPTDPTTITAVPLDPVTATGTASTTGTATTAAVPVDPGAVLGAAAPATGWSKGAALTVTAAAAAAVTVTLLVFPWPAPEPAPRPAPPVAPAPPSGPVAAPPPASVPVTPDRDPSPTPSPTPTPARTPPRTTAPAPAPAPSRTARTAGLSPERQLVNGADALRGRADCPALRVSARLTAVARADAARMAARRDISTVDAEGRGIGDRVTAAGYRWSAVAELSTYGPRSATAALDDWARGRVRDDLLNCRYTEVGVGLVESHGERWWTQVLAAPR